MIADRHFADARRTFQLASSSSVYSSALSLGGKVMDVMIKLIGANVFVLLKYINHILIIFLILHLIISVLLHAISEIRIIAYIFQSKIQNIVTIWGYISWTPEHKTLEGLQDGS
jgi:hypothetical protein